MEVQELLKIEKEYIETHKEHQFIINKYGEFEDENCDDVLFFLERGYFAKHYNISDCIKRELYAKGLTDFEVLMLMCFEGFLSFAFRWDSYEDKPTPIPEICAGLDSVLDKAPIFNDSPVLYRFLTDDDRRDFEVGSIFSPVHYLTTTKDFWNSGDMYIITPKRQNTNAKSLFKLWNHGNENQVTFKRNSCFRITKRELDAKGYKRIYMDEIDYTSIQ